MTPELCPSLAHHVLSVLFRRAGEQVGRIAAQGIIAVGAVVASEEVIRDRPLADDQGVAMGADRDPFAVAKDVEVAVAAVAGAALPRPARIRPAAAVNMGPETILFGSEASDAVAGRRARLWPTTALRSALQRLTADGAVLLRRDRAIPQACPATKGTRLIFGVGRNEVVPADGAGSGRLRAHRLVLQSVPCPRRCQPREGPLLPSILPHTNLVLSLAIACWVGRRTEIAGGLL